MPMTPIGWVPDQYINTILGGGSADSAQPTQAPIYDYSNVDIASDTVPPGVNAMAWRTWSPSQRQQWLDTARWSNWARENPDEYLASLQPDNGFLGDVLGGVGNVINSTVRPIGEFVNENPALLFAAPFIAAAATGAFGAGAASGAGAAGGSAGGAGGLSPITVSATPLAGGVPAVDAAVASALGGSTIPSLASLPGAIATPGAVASFTGAGSGLGAGAGSGILDSSGSVIPGTETVPAGGGGGLGGMFENLLGGNLSNWIPLIGGLLGAIDANNQPGSTTVNQGGTSTSTYGQTLPDTITGPAGGALAQLQAMFNQGTPVAGADPATTAALSRLQNLGTNPFASGSILNNAPTTSSFAGGQTINPYLDTVFNTAANSTQNRLASEFAHAGRLNTGSHQQSRSQELQNLAAGIYGPGFEAERSRQYGAQESGIDRLLAQMEANLGRQFGAAEGNLGRELSSVLPMLTAGDYLRNIQQQQLDAPWMNVQRYMSGLQGLLPFFPGSQTQNTEQTGSVTQPLFSNPLAGFLGGAQLGSLFT